MATKFTTLATGTAVSSAILSVAAAGSILLGGNVHTDSTQNTAPSLVYDSGSYLTYKEAQVTASGSNRMMAQIQSPQLYESGAILNRVNLECDTTPTALKWTAAITTQTKNGTGGTSIPNFTRIAVGTGAVQHYSSGSLKINDGNYVTMLSASGANSTMNSDCKLKTWWSEKYGR